MEQEVYTEDPQQEEQQPAPKLSVPEFASKIKTKYPQYKDVPDDELVAKIINKYPQYKDSVELAGGDKKKVETPAQSYGLGKAEIASIVTKEEPKVSEGFKPTNDEFARRKAHRDVVAQNLMNGKIPSLKEFQAKIPKYAQVNQPVSTDTNLPEEVAMQNDSMEDKTAKNEIAKKTKEEAIENAAKKSLEQKGIVIDYSKPLSLSDYGKLVEEKKKIIEHIGTGSVGGYLRNEAMMGASSMANTASDLTMDALTSILPDWMIGASKEEAMSKWREEAEPTIRTALKDKFGADVSDEKERQFNSQFITATLGGISHMAPAMGLPKGIGFTLQGYDNALQSVNNTEKGRLLPESTKSIFAMSEGLVQGILMDLGMKNIFGKASQAVSRKVAADAINKLVSSGEKNITREMFESVVRGELKTMKQKIADAGGKIGKSALIQGAVGAGIEGANIAAEHILNEATGDNIFDPSSWGEDFGRMMQAAKSGAGMGIVLGGVSVPFNKVENFVSNEVSKVKNADQLQQIKIDLAKEINDGNISENHAVQIGALVDKYAKIYGSIPPEVNNKQEVAEKISERQNLEKEVSEKEQSLQTVDPAFQAPIIEEINTSKGRIEELNQEILEKSQEIERPIEKGEPENISQPIELSVEPENKPIQNEPAASSTTVSSEVEFKDEGLADEPTSANVTERTNQKHPFIAKISDALRKLGILKGNDKVIGGQVQGVSKNDGGGFTTRLSNINSENKVGDNVGELRFNGDGSIRVITKDGTIHFDKNGNPISHDIVLGASDAKDLYNKLEGSKQSIIGLEKIRDSDDFKYKTVEETDGLGNRKKVKRLKTNSELSESTKKINDTINKAKEELKKTQTEYDALPEHLKAKSENKPIQNEPIKEVKPSTTVSSGAKTDADIEKRMAEIETAKTGTPERKEFDELEKEMERRERSSVFDVPLSESGNAIDALLKKEKDKPNGFGSFIEKRDANESKSVIEKYKNSKELKDTEIIKDFKDAVMGNPDTWYADGLKLRESMKEAANRGITIDKLLENVEQEFTKDGFDKETAKRVIARSLEPIFKGASENKTIQNEPIKEGAESTQPITAETKVNAEASLVESGKSAEAGEGGGKKPPVEENAAPEEKGRFKEKGILNRIFNSENVPEHSKKGFEEKGLKYEPQTHEEAERIGKTMVDEYGIEDAVTLAETAKFKGGVNSAIFAEVLNRLYKQEQDAKTPQAKLDAAKQFAEVGIRYDEFGRGQGRDISQIAHFYKKSPLGIKLMEEARRREDFAKFSKNKEQTWKEFFDEMTKEPEFDKILKERVSEELKKERAEARKTRKEKIHKDIDDTIDKWIKKLTPKGTEGVQKQGIGTEEILKSAGALIKKAYDAGESIKEVVQKAVDYISEKLGHNEWGTDEFKKEWEDRLNKTEYKDKKTTEEISEEKRQKLLDRFRNKLKGLSEKEKDEVIRKSFKKLVENGALEYSDFKKIIADTLGYGEMTPEQAKKITDLVTEINAVDDLATKLRENERNEESLKKYQDAKKKAEKSATELGKMVFNRPDIVKRLLSIMQLNTLGIPSLINNPIFNVFNQATVRLPRSIIMTGIDYAIYGGGKLFGKDYKPENNIIQAQREFYKKLGYGSRQSVEQLFTGLTNKDYFQKEVYASQIHPTTSIKELWSFAKGETKLTKAQVIDKTIQATAGVPAEVVARVLNIGDKPQRFAAEGAQAATFAHNLGLQGIDYKLFMEFPKEEAYRKLKKDGLSDEAAMKKAEEIQERIIKEGEESTFQQDNLLNDAITAAFKPFGKAGDILKTLNMPFVKIPLNAFWSVYNLANPEVAMLQSMIYGVKALKSKSPIDIQQSKKWFAHAVTGMAWMGVTGALAKAGIINSPNADDTTKKEREGEQFYEQQNSVNITKLLAYMNGEDPSKVKNGLNVDLKWLGNMGILMGYQAQKLEDMTPEQRDNGISYMEDMMSNLKLTALDFMDKGVFSNTNAMFTAINKGGSFLDNYLINLMNMGANIVQPAAYAQISRAQLPYYSKVKADSFLEQLDNNFSVRSSLYRNLTGKYPPSKIGIWGDTLDKKDNTFMRLFGISRANDDNFAQPIYEDYKKSHNTKFFPSAVKPEIKQDGVTIKLDTKQAQQLETLVGQQRKALVAPYINDMAKFEGSKKRYSQLSSDEEKTDKLQLLYDLGYQAGVKQFFALYPALKPKEKTTKEQNEEDEKSMQKEDLKDANKEKLKLE